MSCCPMPVRDTDWVEPLIPPELSVTTRLAVRVPTAPGVKATSIMQFAPAAMDKLAVQVVPEAVAKSPGSAPVNVTGVAASTRLAPPVFVTVTFCDALVVPTFWALKVRLVGLGRAVGVSRVRVN